MSKRINESKRNQHYTAIAIGSTCASATITAATTTTPPLPQEFVVMGLRNEE